MTVMPGENSSLLFAKGPNACAVTDSNLTIAYLQIIAAFEGAKTSDEDAKALALWQIRGTHGPDELTAYRGFLRDDIKIVRGSDPGSHDEPIKPRRQVLWTDVLDPKANRGPDLANQRNPGYT